MISVQYDLHASLPLITDYQYPSPTASQTPCSVPSPSSCPSSFAPPRRSPPIPRKGARIIFAPHFNAIAPGGLLSHFEKVRSDHTARAVENSIYFVRANNVVLDAGKSGLTRHPESVGYGDSYIVDPGGEMLVRSRRHVEDFIFADIDLARGPDKAWGVSKSAWSHREFHALVAEAAAANLKGSH